MARPKAKEAEKAPRKAPEAKRPAHGEAKAAGKHEAAPALETAAQRKAREACAVAAFMARHPEKRVAPRVAKPLPVAIPEARDDKRQAQADGAPWVRHAKAGDEVAARREYVRWREGNGIPVGVDPLSMLPRAALAAARSQHHRAKGKPLVIELRKRLAAALETALALARELAWPMPFAPPAVETGKGGLPDSAEIVDFLGRAIASADGAIERMPKGGAHPKVTRVLGAALTAAGVDGETAAHFLVGVKLEKNDSHAALLERQRQRGKPKR